MKKKLNYFFDYQVVKYSIDLICLFISATSSEIAVDVKKMGGEVLNYQKLVVPVSMRSVYWKCFGFPASENGQILLREKIICLLCKSALSYNRNTSNLRMHLQNRHARELAQLENLSPRKTKDTTLQTENKSAKKKKEGNMFSSNVSGTVILHNEHNLSSNAGISNADYETAMHLEHSEVDDIDSSQVNIMYSNKNTGASSPPKSNVGLMLPGGEQSCTIEVSSYVII